MGVWVWSGPATPTHPHTHTPIHPYTHTPTHPHTHTPTHPHTHTPTHPHTHTPTHLIDVLPRRVLADGEDEEGSGEAEDDQGGERQPGAGGADLLDVEHLLEDAAAAGV